MAVNFVSARVWDDILIVCIQGEFGGDAEIRAPFGGLRAVSGGIVGPNFEFGHRHGARHMYFLTGIQVRLDAGQEQGLYDLLGMQPLPDAPDCPTHKTKMSPLAPGAWACSTCRPVPEAAPDAVPA